MNDPQTPEDEDFTQFVGIDGWGKNLDPAHILQVRVALLRKEIEDLKKAYYESQTEVARLRLLTSDGEMSELNRIIDDRAKLILDVERLKRRVNNYFDFLENAWSQIERFFLKYQNRKTRNPLVREILMGFYDLLSLNDREPWKLKRKYGLQEKD